MVEPEYDSIMDYLKSNRIGNIKIRASKQLDKVVIDEKAYTYGKENPLSNTLKKKLKSVSKTQGFQKNLYINDGNEGHSNEKGIEEICY